MTTNAGPAISSTVNAGTASYLGTFTFATLPAATVGCTATTTDLGPVVYTASGWSLLQSPTSLLTASVSPSASDRTPLWGGQESNVWYANNQYNCLYTDGAAHLSYRSCLGDPTIAANWSSATTCIGGGNGGESGTVGHSYVYIEGSTLYCYYIQLSSKNIMVATANITTPTTWGNNATIFTGVPGGGSSNGNCCVVKANGVYYLYQESLWGNSFPTEGTTNSWQIACLQSTTPTGTFTLVPSPIQTSGGLGTITGGSGYTNGTYNNVPLTGGSGTGAQAQIIVSGGAVTTVTITAAGSGYLVGDALSANASSIGGTGSGFSVPINWVNGQQSTLRPGPNGSCSGAWMGIVGSTVVAYYHGGTYGRLFPNDIYRATIPLANVGTDGWTISNGGPGSSTVPYNPAIMKRAGAYEFDQIADPYVVTGPNGVSYLFYEGCNNRTSTFEISVTQLLPTPLQIDGTYQHSIYGWIFPQLPYWNTDDEWTYRNFPPGMVSGQANAAINAARTQGTWAIVATTGAPNGSIRTNTSAASGDFIDYDVTLAPGTYTLQLNYQQGPANGIFSIILYDGVATGVTAKTVDSYAAATAYASTTITNLWVLGYETFRWRLRMTCNSKNASSTGFTIADCGFTIQRTGN